MKSLVAAIRHMLFMIHVRVVCLQEASHSAAPAITANQEVKAPGRLVSIPVCEDRSLALKVDVVQALPIMKLDPGRKTCKPSEGYYLQQDQQNSPDAQKPCIDIFTMSPE